VPAFAPYLTGQPCRFVEQTQIAELDFPALTRVAWITCDIPPGVMPAYMILGTSVLTDYGNCDRLEVANLPGILWAQILVEIVSPEGEPPYFRTWVGTAWY